ncbi:MAG: hypothetical protein ACO3UU_04520 [Minisyncoccia bacterium]
MKQKNKFIVGAIIGAIIPFLAVSCKPSPGVLSDEAKVKAISGVLKTGTQMSVSTVVGSNSETRKYFEAAALGIDIALGGKDLTPDVVLKIVKEHVAAIDTAGVYGDLVTSGISLAVGAYKTFYQLNVEKSIQPYLVTLLTGIKEGIYAGMTSSVPTPQGGNPIAGLTKEDLTL